MLAALEVARWLFAGVVALTTIYWIYHVFVSAHMFGPPRQRQTQANRTHRFAVVICAKDEELVIGHLIESLREQDYPTEAFDIFVVADNCTDETARVARQAGATVFERSDATRKSKGFALNWFFPRFAAEFAGRYEACVMFDADNVADPGFLAAMNRQLNAGVPIATGYRMGKNPTSSWIAGSSTLFWLVQSRTFHLARNRLQIPCVSVGGTGFMFDLAVLPDGGWHTDSVCEDIEFTLNSIAAGHFVGYAPEAVFYDEQPLRFMQSVHQRYRWALGSVQVLRISTPRLWRAAWQHPRHALDAFLFSLGGPTTSISALASTGLAITTAALNPSWLLLYGFLASTALSYGLAAAFAYLVLRLEAASWRGAYKSVLTFPIYLVTWQALAIAALFYRDTHWHDIPHVVSVGIHDLTSGHPRNDAHTKG